MDNVISFETKQPVTEATNSEIDTVTPNIQETMLAAAGEVKFSDMIILGIEEGTNQTHFYSVNSDFPNMLWLIESAKLQLLSPQPQRAR